MTQETPIVEKMWSNRMAAVHGLLITFLLLVCLAPSALAYEKNYLPLTRAELARRFPQKRIDVHDPLTSNPSGAEAHFGAATIRLEDDGRLVISGKDKHGHPWELAGEWSGLGCEFYLADLDHNGTEDLIIATPTGGNGWTPSMHLLTLLFDNEGRPIPSELDGYFETDAQGVKDFLDLDQDGHAELLRQSFSAGYWITSLYEARDAHWFLVRGKHGSRSYPLYTRFTNRPNRVATVPKPGHNPQDADLSTGAILDQAPVRIESVQWATVGESQRPDIKLSDGRTCSPEPWVSALAIVVDRETGRQSAMLTDVEDSKALLETIMRDKLPVRISGYRPPLDAGQIKPGNCDPELIWAGAAPRRE